MTERTANGRATVLLTGFGPFPGIPANATSILVPRIADAAQRAFPGIVFETRTLPTEWAAGLDHLIDLYSSIAPSVALHFGVSSRARGFEVEARGRNRSALIPDAVGVVPTNTALREDGPDYLSSTMPLNEIIQRLRRLGVPAFVSRDAGTYLCNATLYTALDFARRDMRDARIGFVHLPSSLVEDRSPVRGPQLRCPLTWRDVIVGGLEVIGAALGRPVAQNNYEGRITRRQT